MAKLDGKKINVFTDDVFHIRTFTCPFQEDGKVVFRRKNFRYSLYMDSDFNVYLIPARVATDDRDQPVVKPDGKFVFVDAYTPEDIVKAAMGDAQANNLIDGFREQIKSQFNKDIMSAENVNELYSSSGRESFKNSYNATMREAGFAEVSDDDFPKTVKTAENFTPEELDFIIKHADEI